MPEKDTHARDGAQPMDPDRLFDLRSRLECPSDIVWRRATEDGIDIFEMVDELLAERDYWRTRAEVNSHDVEAAGVTLAQCEEWLIRDGWTLGSHPDNVHRTWEKPGFDNVRLSPNTPTWTYCLATGIAVTIQIRAKELNRAAFDILEEMAAIAPESTR
jgi:hypothetical protein